MIWTQVASDICCMSCKKISCADLIVRRERRGPYWDAIDELLSVRVECGWCNEVLSKIRSRTLPFSELCRLFEARE